MMYVGLYLLAIVLANLSVTYFGPQFAVFNSFVLIGLDLTCRDRLHEQWHGDRLWIKMLALIATGSILSAALSINALPIAIASFVAFAATGLVDTLIFQRLFERPAWQRVNGSNLASAAVDSLVFSALAFGFPLAWSVIVAQYIAKVGGGLFWSFVFYRRSTTVPLT